MLDAGFVNVQQYADGGWLTGLKYADQIESDLEKATDCEDGKLKKVNLSLLLLLILPISSHNRVPELPVELLKALLSFLCWMSTF